MIAIIGIYTCALPPNAFVKEGEHLIGIFALVLGVEHWQIFSM